MRSSGIVALCLMSGLLGGCQEDARTAADQRLDTQVVKTINNIGIENAILAQHTLYPYEFVAGGEAFNQLGQRDFAVLAQHFAEHPGALNIRRGEEVSPELYQARVAYVTKQLEKAGIQPGRVTISDGLPGGSGVPSERIVTILQQDASATSSGTSYQGKITNQGMSAK